MPFGRIGPSLVRILVIVPAFNESMNIERVVREIRDAAVTLHDATLDIVVINDASTDSTKEAAERTGALVIDLPFNLGIGGAVQTGFKRAVEHGYDIAIQVDGDGQHNPEFIGPLIAPILAGDGDLVIGSRFLDTSSGFQSTFMRRIGIRIFQMLNSLIIRQRITDNTSGFRAYRREVIEFLAEQYPSDYPEPEAVIVLGLRRFRMVEIPVVMRERQGGRSSIGSAASMYYMTKVLLAIIVNIFKNTGDR